MAKDFNTAPNNFGTENVSVTKYLDLAGLSAFWTKAKGYVDDQDQALYDQLHGEIENVNSTALDRIDALSVNGLTFGDYSDKIVLTSENINHGTEAADGSQPTVSSTLISMAEDLEGIHEILGEGATSVVNSVEFDVTHATTTVEGQPEATVHAYVDVTCENKTGELVVKVDDTNIHDKFVELDETIADLEAAAGVASAKVVNSTESGENAGLVSLSIDNTEQKVEADGSYKGNITITMDDSELVSKLGSVDQTLKDHADGIEANAEGIQANAEAIAALQEGTVTDVTKSEDSKENYVSLTIAYAKETQKGEDGETDVEVETNDVVVTIDDSSLKEYTDSVDDKLAQIAAVTVNGKSIISTIDDGYTGQAVVLGAQDIAYSAADAAEGTVAGKISEFDAAIASLASATHFLGVATTTLTDGCSTDVIELANGKTVSDLVNGDVVIAMNDEGGVSVSKEFVWVTNEEYDAATEGSVKGWWYMLGDTTAEAARLDKIETWIDENYITETDIDNLFENAWTPSNNFTPTPAPEPEA